MQVTLSIKIKLRNLTQQQSNDLWDVVNQNTKARNYDSNIYFKHNQNLKVKDFHRLTYHPTINKFHLKSLMAESDRRAVYSTYKTVDTQMRQQTYSFKDINNKKWYHCHKDGQWIWHRIHFHRPQADLQYKYDWRIIPNKHIISINTLHKHKPLNRMKVDYFIPRYFFKYFKLPYKWGVAKLLHSANGWWLHASLTLSVKSIQSIKDALNIGGSDRGERFIGFYKDSNGHITCFRGLPFRRKRQHSLKSRQELQKAYTKHHNYSALKKLSKNRKHENNYMSNENHKCSKILASTLGRNGAIGMENLSGVRASLQQVSKKYRYTQVSWSFSEFGQDTEYKVHLLGGRFIHVSAQFTSQRDPLTGRVKKSNRHHDIHTYYSFKHHKNGQPYQYNDDLIGGLNIQFLTKLACLGYNNPTIQPNGAIKFYIRYVNNNQKNHTIHRKTAYLNRKQAIHIYNSNQKVTSVGAYLLKHTKDNSNNKNKHSGSKSTILMPSERPFTK